MNSLIRDNRLTTIANLVTSKVVADIGTDHGKVVGQLFLDQKIDYAYLSDISSKSLDKAVALLNKLGFQDKAEFIVCDGLNGYTSLKPSDVIIAGMGGEEIIKIISSSKVNDSVNSFILQPMKNVIQLREFLVSFGYKILVDKIIKDGEQYYFVIKAYRGKDKLKPAEKYFGRTNLAEYSADFVQYLKIEKIKYDEIVKNATKLSREKKKYYKVLRKVIKKGEIIC